MKRTGPLIAVFGLFLFGQAALADWSAAKRLTWNSGDSRGPDLVAGACGFLYLVWFDSTPGLAEIYYRRSSDNGATWSTCKRATWTSGWSGYPAIAVDPSDNLHMVWWDSTPGNGEIYYRRSSDGGATWTASKRLTWTSGSSEYPDLAVDSSGNLHVVWHDDTPGNKEIYYKSSLDGGTTWTASKRLTWNSDRSMDPVVAVSSTGGVHVAWADETPGNLEIYHKSSDDGGVSWSSNKRITWAAQASYGDSIAVDSSGSLYVAWHDFYPGNKEIYYRKSTDGGAGWTSSKRITWNAGQSEYPSLATDSSGNLHVVWHDDTPGNREVYYKKSTNGGAAWTSNHRLTWTSGETRWPCVAADSAGNLHVVWQDDTPGNSEVYYKKYIND